MNIRNFLIWLLVLFFLGGAIFIASNTNTQYFLARVLGADESYSTYQEILATGVQPAISPSYDFPHSYQYLNGCVAFTISHILEYKYGEGLDLYEVEEVTEKPREELWKKKYYKKLLNHYNLKEKDYRTAEDFFEFLANGEPLGVSYRYPLEDDAWVLHIVAAYSFDEHGVWVSDSLDGRIRLDYERIFDNSGRFTRYSFSTVEKK